MLGVSSLVQPYAIAAFDYANEISSVSEWDLALQQVGDVLATPTMDALLKNPNVSNTIIVKELIAATDAVLTEAMQRFLYVLEQNDRLSLLPHISETFTKLYAKQNNCTQAELVSAFEVSESQLEEFKEALEKRLNSKVTMACKCDPKLLGGAVVRIDDWVFDGSILGKLTRLKNSLFEANL